MKPYYVHACGPVDNGIQCADLPAPGVTTSPESALIGNMRAVEHPLPVGKHAAHDSCSALVPYTSACQTFHGGSDKDANKQGAGNSSIPDDAITYEPTDLHPSGEGSGVVANDALLVAPTSLREDDPALRWENYQLARRDRGGIVSHSESEEKLGTTHTVMTRHSKPLEGGCPTPLLPSSNSIDRDLQTEWVVMSVKKAEQAAKRLHLEVKKNKALESMVKRHKRDRVKIYDAAMKQASTKTCAFVT